MQFRIIKVHCTSPERSEHRITSTCKLIKIRLFTFDSTKHLNSQSIVQYSLWGRSVQVKSPSSFSQFFNPDNNGELDTFKLDNNISV